MKLKVTAGGVINGWFTCSLDLHTCNKLATFKWTSTSKTGKFTHNIKHAQLYFIGVMGYDGPYWEPLTSIYIHR